jgi:inward rectifier potassium channel
LRQNDSVARRRVRKYRPKGADYEFHVVGDRVAWLRDFYHALLRRSWPVTFGVISGTFLVLNALFATGYLLCGGIKGATPGSFWEAFFFSVQTMGTIGYGAMYPESNAAHALVVVESIAGLMMTALATGLVFAKFSRSTSRMVFSREAVISPVNGVPTLMIRIGNERGNQIVDVQVRIAMSKTEITAEGQMFYRNYDLAIVRDRLLSLSRSWTLFHPIDNKSPLYGQTPESIKEQEIELSLMVVGLDDTTVQIVHASHHYFGREILFGRRHSDILADTPDGNILLDVDKFHDTEPTRATDAFPYPRAD